MFLEQDTMRPVSQAFVTTFSNATFVGASFSAVIPIDLRTKYVVDTRNTAGRRLLQATSSYVGYLPYPVSVSVIKPTLRAYYTSPQRNAWVLLPVQSLAQDSKSISVVVPRSAVVGSGYEVRIAAFAVSQPPPPPPQRRNSVDAQAALQLLPSLLVSPIVPAQPTPPRTPAPTPPPLDTPPPTPPVVVTTTPEPSSPPSMDAGALAGIVIACVVVVGVLGTVLYLKLTPARVKRADVAAKQLQPNAAPAATTELHAMFRIAGASVAKKRNV